MKIAVGTTSEPKLRYLQEVLTEVGIPAEIIACDVPSSVSEQPMSLGETRQGSLQRARLALQKESDATFGLGIEVGYQEHKKNIYAIFCCASIVDKNGSEISSESSKYVLPEYHQKILQEGNALGHYVKSYKEYVDLPIVNYLREMIRNRKPFIIESIRNVLLLYLESTGMIDQEVLE